MSTERTEVWHERLPADVVATCHRFVTELRRLLADSLAAVYLYGAVAFPGCEGDLADIDFHVLVRRGIDPQRRQDLERMHQMLAREHDPHGAGLDGYYLLIDDAKRADLPRDQLRPQMVDESWALHRAHMLAGRCIVLHGPDPAEVYAPPSWPDIVAALDHEIRYVEEHLADEAAAAYCVLNLCRIVHSFETRDVVTSKRDAGEWALRALPLDWHEPVRAALRAYRGEAHGAEERTLQAALPSLFAYARARIDRARGPEDA